MSGFLDHDQLSQWFHEHGAAVRGYLRASVRREDIAEDILQEVFRRAWEARERYQESGAARAYLLRIADRLLCDRSRRAAREAVVETSDWARGEPQGADPDPVDQASRAEDKQRLEAALSQLSALQRRVVLLRYYSGMSFADIAQTVGCPLNTALSHCRRALLTLRRFLVEVSS